MDPPVVASSAGSVGARFPPLATCHSIPASLTCPSSEPVRFPGGIRPAVVLRSLCRLFIPVSSPRP